MDALSLLDEALRAPDPDAALCHAVAAIARAHGGWCAVSLGDDPRPVAASGPVDGERDGERVSTPLVAWGTTCGALHAGPAERWTDSALAPLARALAPVAHAALARRRAAAGQLDFLAVAAHELRNPLSSMLLLTQALASSLDRPDASRERLRGLAERAVRQGNRAAKLLDRIFDIVGLEGPRALELERRPIDLAALVREVAQGYAEDLQHAGCELRLAAPTPVEGEWDASRLEQVVTNLLANVLKYAPGRPVELRVERDAAAARVVVRDHGPGIAREALATLFERFHRARQHGVPGLGLGLYLSRRIVEAHGGTLRAHSEPGRGATFVVELPAGGGGGPWSG